MAQNFVDPDTFKDPDDIVEKAPPLSPPSSMVRRVLRTAAENARPFLQGAGATIGGAVAIPPAIASGPAAPITEAAGIATGYYGGNKLADIVEDIAGVRKQPEKPVNAFTQGVHDVKESVEQGVMGPVFGKALKVGAKVVGRVGKEVLGRWGGAGAGSIDEAVTSGRNLKGPNIIKSQTTFDRAMRGEIAEDEPVRIAKNALQKLRDERSLDYTKRLEAMSKPSRIPATSTEPGKTMPPVGRRVVSLEPIKAELNKIIKDAGVIVKRDGSLDYSSTGLGDAGNRDLAKIIEKVKAWGNQGPEIQRLKVAIKGWGQEIAKTTDPEIKKTLEANIKNASNTLRDLTEEQALHRSPLGLDKLKRALGDEWSESGNARAFISRMENKVKDTVVSAVPEYREMLKNYEEATTVIKDIEKVFNMKGGKPATRGESDRILTRLMNVMKKDSGMSKELVGILSKPGSEANAGELTQMLAGRSMAEHLPKSNLVLFGEGFAVVSKIFNPRIIGLITGSSPRVQGEFLRIFGKFLQETKGGTKVLGQAAAIGMYGNKKISEMTDDDIKDALRSTLGFGKEAVAASTKPNEKKKTFGVGE